MQQPDNNAQSFPEKEVPSDPYQSNISIPMAEPVQQVTMIPDAKPYNGPMLYYISLVLIVVGYIMMWVGLCLNVANDDSLAVIAWVMEGIGFCMAIGGCIMMCVVMRPEHEKPMCIKAIIAILVLGFLMLIPYCIIVFTTDYHETYNDNENAEQFGRFATGVMRTWLCIFGVAVVSVSGCVACCFCCCVLNRAQEPPSSNL